MAMLGQVRGEGGEQCCCAGATTGCGSPSCPQVKIRYCSARGWLATRGFGTAPKLSIAQTLQGGFERSKVSSVWSCYSWLRRRTPREACACRETPCLTHNLSPHRPECWPECTTVPRSPGSLRLMANTPNGSADPEVTFTIKNPSKHDAFKLTVPLSATLADIKGRIAAEYDGNPSPNQQTVRACPAASRTLPWKVG
jgi:hypothetical protein